MIHTTVWLRNKKVNYKRHWKKTFITDGRWRMRTGKYDCSITIITHFLRSDRSLRKSSAGLLWNERPFMRCLCPLTPVGALQQMWSWVIHTHTPRAWACRGWPQAKRPNDSCRQRKSGARCQTGVFCIYMCVCAKTDMQIGLTSAVLIRSGRQDTYLFVSNYLFGLYDLMM